MRNGKLGGRPKRKKLPIPQKKNCLLCGTEFQPTAKYPQQRFCSRGYTHTRAYKEIYESLPIPAGKSSTSKLVAAGHRVCVLDTVKSDWWGITARGTKPGLPFKILGGPRGHVPLHANAGKVIGQLVGSGKLPLPEEAGK